MEQHRREGSGIQMRLLLQAVIVIIVTGVSILLLTRFIQLEFSTEYFSVKELFFLATIANLVFFHTTSTRVLAETAGRLYASTAVISVIASVVLFFMYFVMSLI